MKKSTILRLGAAIAAGGVCFQLGSCTQFAGQLNPCGTILNCDPAAFLFATVGASGLGNDLASAGANSPFCTVPPFCAAAQDPLYGPLGGGNP
ncbi:MAG: hypothetical protein KDA32_10480 [Phycisphaerales bacterium]|nr:hypothetical protein [Phycisphaerales bacterium]